MEKKLYRDEHRKVIGGVCAGLADYFGVDVSIIRAVFVICLLLKGVGLLPYLVLWIVLPKRIYDFNNPNANSNFNPGVDYTNFNPNYNQTYNNPHVDYTIPQPPFGGQPFTPAPRKKSNAGLIFGVVLIILGGIFLLDEFDIVPDFDFEKTWPIVLVAIGGMLIVTGQKKEPWEKHNWQNPPVSGTQTADTAADADKKDEQTNTL